MQLIKKTLRRRAKLCYNAAIFPSLTSLTIADAARTALTFNLMIGTCLVAVIVFVLAMICLLYYKHLDIKEEGEAR